MNKTIVENVKERGYLSRPATQEAVLQAVKRLEELAEQLELVHCEAPQWYAMMIALSRASKSARDIFRNPDMVRLAEITNLEKFAMEAADQVVTLACEEAMMGADYEALALEKSAGDVKRGVSK